MIKDLLKIAFPNNCISCSHSLLKQEQFFCLYCYTSIHLYSNSFIAGNEILNEIQNNNIQHAGSLWIFEKEGISQKALHELKYKGNKKIGLYLGELMGINLLKTNQTFDYLLPIPLHKSKLKQRGYNQSEILAQGISSILKVKVGDFLIRTRHTETQTKKSKLERIENVKDAFTILNSKNLEGKNILLVDDVITTGTTINECVKTLSNEIPDLNISIYSLAFAKI